MNLKATAIVFFGAFAALPAQSATITLDKTYAFSGSFNFSNPIPIYTAAPLIGQSIGTIVGTNFTFDSVSIQSFGSSARLNRGALATGELGFVSGFPGHDIRADFVTPIGYTAVFSTPYDAETGAPLAPVSYGGGPSNAASRTLYSSPKTDSLAIVATSYSYCGGGYAFCSAGAGSAGANYSVQVRASTTYELPGKYIPFAWLNNKTSETPIPRKLQPWESIHVDKVTKKVKYVSIGVRGAIDFEGMSVHTASPGVLAYEITLPVNDDAISVPLVFTKNNKGSFVDILFNGSSLLKINGDDYELDELNTFDLNISSFKGQKGQLKFVIDTSGPNSAEIFVPDSVPTENYVIKGAISPAPEPEAYAMLLAGLGLISAAVSRRKARQA